MVSHPQLHMVNTVITWTASPEETSDEVPGFPRDTDAKSNKFMLILGQEEFMCGVIANPATLALGFYRAAVTWLC